MLLTVMDPFAGLILFCGLGLIVLAIYNFIAAGLFWLIARYSSMVNSIRFGRLYSMSLLVNIPVVLVMAIHNVYGLRSVQWVRQLYQPEPVHDKFQPVEIFVIWTVILLLTSLVLIQRKQRGKQ